MTTTTFDSCFGPDEPLDPSWQRERSRAEDRRMAPRNRTANRVNRVVKFSNDLVAIGYPIAPSSQRGLGLLPPAPQAERSRLRIATAQAQIEAELPALQQFEPSTADVETFVRAANGTGLDRFALWLMRAQYSARDAVDVLAEAVEGGLIATLQYLRRDDLETIAISQTDELVLRHAIARRIPRVPPHVRDDLAQSLVQLLRSRLEFGRFLMIDGAKVSVIDNHLVGLLASQSHGNVVVGEEKGQLLAA